MAASDVQRLLAAVRRRLWREQFAAAVRMAAWVTAGGVLLAAAIHGAVLALPVGAVLAALGLVWAALLARAAWRRPDDPTCALWADRHLGGASAFTTLLDTGRHGSDRAQTPAMRWLRDWAAARVPDSLRALAARRDPARLARPLLTMAVCSALATLVLTLPGVAPAPPPAATPASAAVSDAALRLAEAPEPSALAQEISSALRAAQPRDASPPGGGSRAPAGEPAQANDAGPSASASADVAPADARATGQPAGAARNTGAAATSATQAAGSGGGGREAGDSADTRADPGASRALRGTMTVQGAALAAGRRSAQRRADSNQAARYESDDSESTRSEASAMRAQPAPAAATPPPATETTRLTATETHYVQAWMRASERRP